MSYTITLTTEDGQQLQFSCAAGQSVLEAAEVAGFFLPALCNAGSCGSCLGRCSNGSYHLGAFSPTLLPANHQQTGEVLFCRMYPDSDVELTAPYPAAHIRTQRQTAREAEITQVELIAERTMRLQLNLLPDAQQSLAFEFEPGQFVELEIPELALKRAYSLANTPNWEGKLEFLIRLQPHGQFSTYLQQQARIGQRLLVSSAAGNFGVQVQSLNPRCFVAGGTGLAPFLSMLRRMAEWGENHPVRLFFGVNNEREIFCQQELTALQQAIPQLQVEICVWRVEESWTGFKGTPADALKAYLEQAEILPDVFLCGPPLMVEAAKTAALAAGVKPEQIFCENFA